MCLSLTVTLPQGKQNEADFIAENSSTNEMKAYKEKRLFGRAARYLFIASEAGNCACDLLTDNADWNAETWDIIPSNLPHISSVVSNIHQHLPEGFLFEALWAGDKPIVKKEVTIAELARLIQNNKIETKTTYQVTSADGEKRGGLAG
ncbi:hypothetical protein ACFL6N_06710 [Thermodesulfobacteriota bacterium]